MRMASSSLIPTGRHRAANGTTPIAWIRPPTRSGRILPRRCHCLHRKLLRVDCGQSQHAGVVRAFHRGAWRRTAVLRERRAAPAKAGARLYCGWTRNFLTSLHQLASAKDDKRRQLRHEVEHGQTRTSFGPLFAFPASELHLVPAGIVRRGRRSAAGGAGYSESLAGSRSSVGRTDAGVAADVALGAVAAQRRTGSEDETASP